MQQMSVSTIPSAPALAGLMQSQPLLISELLQHAQQRYPQQQIVSFRGFDAQQQPQFHRYSWRDCAARSAQLANALLALGVQPGDRIASMAWNSYRHVELYYGVSGIGAVLHTVNPRLFPEQIAWMLEHAEDQWLFVDPEFVPLLNQIAGTEHAAVLQQLRGIFVLADASELAALEPQSLALEAYETLLAPHSDQITWPSLAEESAALLCYTSGTTGHPKGVLQSHRAVVLHAQATVGRELLDLNDGDVLLPMVAMYHVAAWGAPYAAPLAGCKLMLPGSGMSGAAMAAMIDSEQVTVALGVPTIWSTLHSHLQSQPTAKIASLKRVCVGGAASPMGLVQAYWEHYQIYWQPIWGMTETGPLVCSAPPSPALMALPLAERYALQTTAGRACFGTQIEIFDGADRPLPHDGVSQGELRVRGGWITAQYYRRPEVACCIDGWLATGDIAVIDAQGYMKVVDRKKDVIKSGGEWISSLDIESIVSQHRAVRECCVIGVKHPKWDERPLLLVVCQPNQTLSKAEVLDFLQGKIAKWWTPDDVLFVAELPHTGTGKLLKNELRQHYQNYLLTPAEEGK